MIRGAKNGAHVRQYSDVASGGQRDSLIGAAPLSDRVWHPLMVRIRRRPFPSDVPEAASTDKISAAARTNFFRHAHVQSRAFL